MSSWDNKMKECMDVVLLRNNIIMGSLIKMRACATMRKGEGASDVSTAALLVCASTDFNKASKLLVSRKCCFSAF